MSARHLTERIVRRTLVATAANVRSPTEEILNAALIRAAYERLFAVPDGEG